MKDIRIRAHFCVPQVTPRGFADNYCDACGREFTRYERKEAMDDWQKTAGAELAEEIEDSIPLGQIVARRIAMDGGEPAAWLVHQEPVQPGWPSKDEAADRRETCLDTHPGMTCAVLDEV